MAALENYFELLGDDESDDALNVLLRFSAKTEQQRQTPAKLPSKPLPPSQAGTPVKESKASQSDSGRGRGGRGGGRDSFGSRGRGREGGFNRPFRGGSEGDPGGYADRSNTFNRGGSDFQGSRGSFYNRRGEASHGPYGNGPALEQDEEAGQGFERARGRGRGRNRGRGYSEGGEEFHRGYGDGLDGEYQQQRRDYEGRGTGRRDFQRIGTGGGTLFNRHDAGGGNRGTETEHAAPEEREETITVEEQKFATELGEKQPAEETQAETQKVEEVKEQEDNEMLLDDYYKILNEKKKRLALRAEERKVISDKDFEGMQLLNKKQDEGTLLKHVSEKDKGKREISDREERTKKSVSINEFLRPMEGEGYFSPVGRRGRGRGRGDRGGSRGGFRGSYNTSRQDLAPSIEDPGQFPTLGVK